MIRCLSTALMFLLMLGVYAAAQQRFHKVRFGSGDMALLAMTTSNHW